MIPTYFFLKLSEENWVCKYKFKQVNPKLGFQIFLNLVYKSNMYGIIKVMSVRLVKLQHKLWKNLFYLTAVLKIVVKLYEKFMKFAFIVIPSLMKKATMLF